MMDEGGWMKADVRNQKDNIKDVTKDRGSEASTARVRQKRRAKARFKLSSYGLALREAISLGFCHIVICGKINLCDLQDLCDN